MVTRGERGINGNIGINIFIFVIVVQSLVLLNYL